MKSFQIIQGGMGIGVSGWRLARTVSMQGQLGVVSSTAIDLLMVRKLQDGDSGGDIRRALQVFPDQAVAGKILERYFIDGGKADGVPYAAKPMIGDRPGPFALQLVVAANFVEVYLAKEGHDGCVGSNYLHKIQAPLLAGLYGAMLAGVDVVIVGAGIPLEIPAAIGALCRGEKAALTLPVLDSEKGSVHKLELDPVGLIEGLEFPIPRPRFFPIVSSVTLASMLVKKCAGEVDGLILEKPVAGGHNAPPRGRETLNEAGEPVYGPRDEINLEAIRKLEVPFWLAGAYASPEKLREAKNEGAEGVQIGSAFAFCGESGLRPDLKTKAVELCLRDDSPSVFKDPKASPTGFPFQVLKMEGTLSEDDVYAGRERRCDLGYLREPFEKENGTLGWRCKAEDVDAYVKKGGDLSDTVNRKCLCNSLMANIGLGQVRAEGIEELPLITCGEDLAVVRELAVDAENGYSATKVLDHLLSV